MSCAPQCPQGPPPVAGAYLVLNEVQFFGCRNFWNDRQVFPFSAPLLLPGSGVCVGGDGRASALPPWPLPPPVVGRTSGSPWQQHVRHVPSARVFLEGPQEEERERRALEDGTDLAGCTRGKKSAPGALGSRPRQQGPSQKGFSVLWRERASTGQQALSCPFHRCGNRSWELTGPAPARCHSPAATACGHAVWPPLGWSRWPRTHLPHVSSHMRPLPAPQDRLPSLAFPLGQSQSRPFTATRSGWRPLGLASPLFALGAELLLGAAMPRKSPQPGRWQG